MSANEPPGSAGKPPASTLKTPPRRRAWQPSTPPENPASTAGPKRSTPRTPTADATSPTPLRQPRRPVRNPAAPPDPGAGRPAAPRARAVTRRRGGFRVPGGLRRPAIISRGERVLFWALLAAVIAMSIFLARYRARVNAHFQSRALAVPLAGDGAGAAAPLLLALADDDTGALLDRRLSFPLPRDPNTRARVVLEKLLAEYTAPDSTHPLKALPPGVPAVDEVYLLPVPGGSPRGRSLLAVVDLTPAFVRLHPSGIEPETLTLLSMIATLHANLPAVSQVHFLVDGQPRPTLAGHADLTRTYLAGPAQMEPREAFTTSR